MGNYLFNFVVSNKRNLMYGDLERGAYLEVIGELAALPNPEVVGEALRLSPNGWLWRGHQLIPEEGFGSATNAGVFVIGFAAGQITRLECFDETDLDAAQARFEELTAAPVARSFAEGVGFEWIDRARRRAAPRRRQRRRPVGARADRTYRPATRSAFGQSFGTTEPDHGRACPANVGWPD